LRNPDRYAEEFLQELPPGKVYPSEPIDTGWFELSQGLTDETVRVEESAEEVLSDALPDTTVGYLDDWERITDPFENPPYIYSQYPASCGLAKCGRPLVYWEIDPTGTIPLVATDDELRDAILTKLRAHGGASIPYWIQVLEDFGNATPEIEEIHPCFCGTATSGTPCYDWQWAYVWIVNIIPNYADWARSGVAVSGDRIFDYSLPFGWAFVQRYKPAHTWVIFRPVLYVVDEFGDNVVDEFGNYVVAYPW